MKAKITQKYIINFILKKGLNRMKIRKVSSQKLQNYLIVFCNTSHLNSKVFKSLLKKNRLFTIKNNASFNHIFFDQVSLRGLFYRHNKYKYVSYILVNSKNINKTLNNLNSLLNLKIAGNFNKTLASSSFNLQNKITPYKDFAVLNYNQSFFMHSLLNVQVFPFVSSMLNVFVALAVKS